MTAPVKDIVSEISVPFPAASSPTSKPLDSPVIPQETPGAAPTIPIRTKRKKNPRDPSRRTVRSGETSTTPDPDARRYKIKDGLRRVKPYYWKYNTFAKGRWLDRTLVDVFECEMRDRPQEYYRAAIKAGKITVNGIAVPGETMLKNGDLITHTLHRHEPPVSGNPVGIVAEINDLLAIDKPAGVPVHPTGRYHYNSVTEILRHQFNDAFNPRPCNRLDRLTSGLMFVGKTSQATDAFTLQLRSRTVRKEYIAKVLGEFPEGDVVCGHPILQISPKLGLNAVRANGKEARTIFKRMAYYPPAVNSSSTNGHDRTNGPTKEHLPWQNSRGYSIVRCFPLTGRTHQIRVHLQFLGHPITNDPIYANQRVFGPNLWAAQDTSSGDEAVLERLEKMGKEEVAEAVAYYDELVDTYHARKQEQLTGEFCADCGTSLYSDPGEHELGIYLHARRYACEEGKWAYETGLPAWALPPSDTEGPTNVGPENEVAEDIFQRERLELEKSVLPKGTQGMWCTGKGRHVNGAKMGSTEEDEEAEG